MSRRQHGRRDLRRRYGVKLRELAARRQSARLRLELHLALAISSDGSAARAGAQWLFLHARIELLLPIARFQSEASGANQKAGAAVEEVACGGAVNAADGRSRVAGGGVTLATGISNRTEEHNLVLKNLTRMPESNAKKFLIITSDTGGGHTSAAT